MVTLTEAQKIRGAKSTLELVNGMSPAYLSMGERLPELNLAAQHALDEVYHYGVSSDPSTFGYQSTTYSVKYGLKAIEGIYHKLVSQGARKNIAFDFAHYVDEVADQIHEGWNAAAIHDAKMGDVWGTFEAQLKSKYPDRSPDTESALRKKIEARSQLAAKTYAQLPEDEKEKDRVVARFLIQTFLKAM